MNFKACQKTLAAIGDEARQHIILEMIRMDYNGSRVPDITKNEPIASSRIATSSDSEGRGNCKNAQGRPNDILLPRPGFCML